MKNAIIIGGTSGIGKELSKILVKENWTVAVTGRRENIFDASFNKGILKKQPSL